MTEQLSFRSGHRMTSLWLFVSSVGLLHMACSEVKAPARPDSCGCEAEFVQCQTACQTERSCQSSCERTRLSCDRICQAGQPPNGGSINVDLGFLDPDSDGGVPVAGACPDLDTDGYQDITCNPDPRNQPPGGDCDDYNNTIRPNRFEDCGNNVDNDCNGFAPFRDPACQRECPDADGDGHQDISCNGDRSIGGDCDDASADVNPSQTEVCGNGRDDDCSNGDATCVMNCIDTDLDGFGRGAGCLGPDCNDIDARINPWASEVCSDGLDQNCDGEDSPCPDDCEDRDRDGYGQGMGCHGLDCNDDNPNVNPGARDIPMDGIDQDCNGRDLVLPPDCIQDNDRDGYGRDEGCLGIDCDDNNPVVNSGRSEICGNQLDDDCLGGDAVCVEQGEGECEDLDGDGYGRGACPEGGRDCDEESAWINPGAEEECDGDDNDCDGWIDECPRFGQSCHGGDCVGDIGSACNGDRDCVPEPGVHCDMQAGQCRLRDGETCNAAEQCGPGSDCGRNPDCGPGRRCYRRVASECEEDCDCGSQWYCHEANFRCVQCTSDQDCDEERHFCASGGYCTEPRTLGGGGIRIREVELCTDDCNGIRDCTDTCEWAEDEVCDDGGPRSAFGLCDLGTDCTDCGPRFEPASNGQCEDGGAEANVDQCTLGSDCSDCGIRIVEVEDGTEGVTDALLDVLLLMTRCWSTWTDTNDAQGCYALDIPADVMVDGDIAETFGGAEYLEDQCDGSDFNDQFEARLTDHMFMEEDVEILEELVGCGLLDLSNLSWEQPVERATDGDFCIFYAPNKSGFGFPQRFRAAIIVDSCTLSALN